MALQLDRQDSKRLTANGTTDCPQRRYFGTLIGWCTDGGRNLEARRLCDDGAYSSFMVRLDPHEAGILR